MNIKGFSEEQNKRFSDMRKAGIFHKEFAFPVALFVDIEKAIKNVFKTKTRKRIIKDVRSQYKSAKGETSKRIRALKKISKSNKLKDQTVPVGAQKLFSEIAKKYNDLQYLLQKENEYLQFLDRILTNFEDPEKTKEFITKSTPQIQELVQRLEYLYEINIEHRTGNIETGMLELNETAAKFAWIKKVLNFYGIDVEKVYIKRILK